MEMEFISSTFGYARIGQPDTSETEKLKLGGLAQSDWVTDNAYFSKTGGDSLQDRLTKSVHKECEKKGYILWK